MHQLILLARITCIFFVCSVSFSAQAQSYNQPGFSQQLSVITENDRYLMQGRDRYYTNGLMINYQRTGNSKNQSTIKQVHQYELGQKLFTPFSRKIYDASQIDRPVTGYLYGKYTQSNFKEHNQLVQWSASIGAIGKASLGQGMQNMFHKIISVNSDWWGWIWGYQLKSAAGINLHGLYAKGLLNDQTSFVQITPVSQAIAGMIYTNISQGLLIQLGKFNPLHQSSYWNASVDDEQTPGTELFFYYHPELMYQFYNATVQGGMFLKDKGPIVSEIEPWAVKHQIGAAFAISRYTLKLEMILQGKEARSQHFTHNYGGIHLGYRFN
ncbi:MAG: lipid A deacylase LpxR family protein [Lacibacter sp.]|nr:lipid A deacylase LpxR family protein [Lacibacter sp.]